MKRGTIFSSLFAIMLFVGTSNAQHVKVFTGQDYSLIGPSTPSAAIPTVDLVAGEPIRLQVAKMQTANNLKQIGLAVHTYSTSCSEQPVARKGGGTQLEYMTITLSDAYIASTEIGWKGTCRILSVRIKNGKEYQARLRFR